MRATATLLPIIGVGATALGVIVTVIFEKTTVEANKGRETLLFRLVGRWDVPLRIGALVPLILVDLVVGILLVGFVWEYLNLQFWLVRYSNRWTAFIWEQDLDEQARETALAKPWTIRKQWFRPEWADELQDK